MIKKRFVSIVLSLFFFLLSVSAGLTPFIQFSPYLLVDNTPLLYPNGPTGGDSGFRAMLDNAQIEGSYETIQDSILRCDKRPELLNFGFEIDGENVFFAIKVEIREELYNQVTFSPKSNIPWLGNTRYSITDAMYPQVGFVEYSTPSFLFSIGRRKLDMGPGKYSFMLSEEAQPNLDSVVVGANYIEGKFRLEYSFFIIGGSNSTISGFGNETDKMKTFFIHKVVAGNDKIRFGVSDMNCVYGAVPGIYDFSPFVLWHNAYQEEHSNVMIEASLEGKIGPFRLWGEYAQDDLYLNAGSVNEGSFNNKPTGIGFGLGFDWKISDSPSYTKRSRNTASYALKEMNLREEGGIHLNGEFYWATNYLYNRRSSENGKFLNDRYGKITLPYRFYSSHGGFTDKIDAYFLGFPYGPGSILFSLSLDMEKEWIKGEIRTSLLMRGDDDIDSVIDASTKDTWLWLNGDVKRVWSLGGYLKLKMDKYVKGLEVEADITLGYDEYYSSLVPIVKIGLIESF